MDEREALHKENHKTIGQWLFEDVICCWGCIAEIITDNAGQFKKVTAWIESKYGIRGIAISPYNSQANGKIERLHWNVRQALFKACEDCTKWFWFFFHVMWSDHITIWQKFWCSPYFMVTGAHPTLPLDLVEATWLIELPEGPLSTEELIAYCARALAKHHQHVKEMRERVRKDKLQWVLKFAEEHKNSIKDFNFRPLDLVLVKNMITESSHSAKMLPYFHGPMVVITKTKGGNHIVAKLNRSFWQTRVAVFRVVSYRAQRQLELSQCLEQWVDITPEKLKELREELQKPTRNAVLDLSFGSIRLHEPLDYDIKGLDNSPES
ncbi:hypothetical protein J132_04422 [Termitomyces sp. J132]|nr:hypothetical protein J132_04422 [Termitomyces sp. J132]